MPKVPGLHSENRARYRGGQGLPCVYGIWGGSGGSSQRRGLKFITLLKSRGARAFLGGGGGGGGGRMPPLAPP